MAGYIETNSRLKNTIVLKAFAMSFLFVLIYALSYYIGAGAISDHLPGDRGGFFAVWGPSFLIALVASAVCCLPMAALQDKVLVPATFLFIALYYVIILAVFLSLNGGEHAPVILQLVSLYALPPALTGNLLGWGFYLWWRRSRAKKYHRPQSGQPQ